MPNAVNVTYAVYIDWAYAGSGAPDFTQPIDTITSYVKSVSCTLGITRPDENVAYTGTATLTVNNADRRFSPLYSSGAYYGNLVGGKPVKITITQSGSTYTIWTGYTRQIKVTTGQYAAREATIECVDIMARLQDEMIAIPLQENVSASTLLKHVVNTAMKSAVATGTLTIATGNASDGDTVAIAGTTLTYKSALTGASNEVLVGTTNSDSANNLIAALHHDSGAGTAYASIMSDFPVSAVISGLSVDMLGGSTAFPIGNYSGSTTYAAMTLSNLEGVLAVLKFGLGASVGAPSGTMTWEIQSDTGANRPSGTVLQTGTFTPTASATNTINVAGGITLSKTTIYHLILKSTSAQSSGNYWYLNGTSPRTYQYGWSLFNNAGVWSDFSGYQSSVAVLASSAVTLTARIRGAVGNYALAKSGANLTLSGAAMTGGTDYTPSSYETGDETFTFGADEWNSSDTNGMSAVQDVIDSEQGLFWIARDGTVTFKARNYLFKRPTAASSLTLNSEQTDFDATMDQEQIANRVEVEVRPRAALSAGVVAESKATIVVPGQSGTARWNGTVVLPGGGSTTVKLPFTDPATGKPMGAKSLITPLTPYTDFYASDYESGGFDYTTAGGVNFFFSFAINGGNVEITITNNALGPLYFTKLQVRGTGIVNYDPQTHAVEDGTSQNAYGKRVKTVKLPLPSTVNYAKALAEYTLGRYKDPAFRVNSISFGGQNLIGAVKLYSLEIGDIITLTDYQSAITAQKYMITGIEVGNLTPRAPGEITYFIRRIDDQTYWILEDATYGVLGTTTRLGV